eukprot:COSAG02_NODE_170_length_31534_cov_33.568498_8_plen_112_part_00
MIRITYGTCETQSPINCSFNQFPSYQVPVLYCTSTTVYDVLINRFVLTCTLTYNLGTVQSHHRDSSGLSTCLQVADLKTGIFVGTCRFDLPIPYISNSYSETVRHRVHSAF